MLLARSANLEAATAAAFNKDINNQNLVLNKMIFNFLNKSRKDLECVGGKGR